MLRAKKSSPVFTAGLTPVTSCRRQRWPVGVGHTACSLCVHTKQCSDVGVGAGK